MAHVDLSRACGTLPGYWRGCRCPCCRGAKSEADRLHYQANRERIRERQRQWYAEHREQAREAQRRWEAENGDRVHAIRSMAKRNYRARQAAAHGKHTLADVAAQRRRQRGRCYWCGARYGRHYHVDHVVPLVLGGSNGPENLVITCPDCNLRKNATHPMDFAGVLL